MDMYQKRKMRQEKKNNGSQESFSKVTISWYPGHMAKTKREIKEKIDLIDIVFEVVDARIPYSSKNKEIEEITSKPLNEKLVLEYLKDGDNSCAEKDIVIFEKRRILVRAITDYIAGMTDGYALEEYEKLR